MSLAVISRRTLAFVRTYTVYILANASKLLYTGVTSNLERRIHQHKRKLLPKSFTAQCNITRLVYVEQTSDVHAAIERERQIKSWTRRKKVALIEKQNPGWHDLAANMNRDGGFVPWWKRRRTGT